MKLLVAVAHPDDEAFGCGSVLAHAGASGVESVVVCATRGELGDYRGTPVPSQQRLGQIREAELRGATALLGVSRVDVLDWLDSGVNGAPAPGSLAAAPASAVGAAIGAIVDEIRPDVIVTLDATDGHRDHAVVRDATLAVATRAGWPHRAYLWCLPRSLLSAFAGDPNMGTPDEDITTTVDTRPYLDLRWAAMRAHSSQACPYDAMEPEMQRAFLSSDRLVRVDADWTGGREDDWVPATARLRP